jgi:PEP-CTERM motif
MRNLSVTGILASLAICGLSSQANASSVDLSSYLNANLNTYTQGFNYPTPGSITIGGVSFTLGNFQGGPGAIQAPASGKTFDITGLNFNDAGVAYTIINSAFGASGSNIGSIEFIGLGGANVTYQLVEGNNVRDHYYGSFNNFAANLFATAAYQNGNVVPDGPGLVHFDVQQFSLAGLNGQNLSEIIFTGNGSSGGLPFLAAVTTEVAAVPEPSTWAMMILGFFGLGFMAYRRKNSAVQFA